MKRLLALGLAALASAANCQTLRIGLAEDPDILDPTLARTYGLLRADEWRGLSVRQLVETELEAAMAQRAVDCDGPAVTLTAFNVGDGDAA